MYYKSGVSVRAKEKGLVKRNCMEECKGVKIDHKKWVIMLMLLFWKMSKCNSNSDVTK